MTTKESGLIAISTLVERFKQHLKQYKKSTYNETTTRRDFIDPFFKALGWDMDNSQGALESYREVIHEDKVIVDGAKKSPDYSFRYGGDKLFFVEAKKPSVDVKDDSHPAYQVRRYGWSAELKVSIITDFEEFAVYDCTKKPKEKDKASVARLKYLTFSDYIKEWDFLWNTFSREAVIKGKFKEFAAQSVSKKGTDSVDSEFLNSLDQWRTLLAESINEDNFKLNEDELNFAVQQTLDRLIFLRITEDRNIEPYSNLQKCLKGANYFKNILIQFQNADKKYNSGLFDFTKDKISERLTISNDTIATIINSLYYPECPYAFSVISVEILGSAYEQFLGKTITIDERGKASIEFKPDVRKAGGVYYTPQRIVDYIVEHTIGNLIKNKTPEDVAKIKIADPACGSGSFLLGAYQYLLTWHRNYYVKNKSKKKLLTPEGNLTTDEKKRILINNIYGVDIDTNAVEVTKLSLLLKCLEGETLASIDNQFTFIHERILPTLDSNIKSGNSLIDMNYLDLELDFREERKLKPFSWKKEFSEVFKNGGFDVIIGNPPYVKMSDENQISYFNQYYSCQNYQYDLYLLFLEKYKYLMVENGLLGVIIPNTWLQSIKFQKIRKHLTTEYRWQRILHITDHVFKAVVDTHVLVFEKNKVQADLIQIDKLEKGEINNYQVLSKNDIPSNGDVINIVAKKEETILFNKIKEKSLFIGNECFSTVGVKPFQTGKGKPKQTQQIVIDKPYVVENTPKPKGNNWLPLMRGSLMNKYVSFWNEDSWIQYGEWLAEPRKPFVFEADEKIIVRQTGDSIIATIVGKDIICRNNLHILISAKMNHKFILGVLNSKLTNFYYYQINPERGEALAEVKKNHVEQLPIPHINKKNKALHNQIIDYVDKILLLNIDLQKATLATQKDQYKGKIGHYEDRINEIVYQLYELSEDEIKTIENT
jgi:adenine-specific DNA-methyltransferase